MRLALALLFAAAAFAQKAPRESSYLSSSDEILPQVIWGGEWTSKITLTNLRSSAVEVPIQFWGADGKTVSVPLIGRAASDKQTVNIPAAGQVTIETPYDPSIGGVIGWAELSIPCTLASDDSCGRVAANVTLKNRNATRPDFEAVFQARDGSSGRLILPVDNAAGHSTALMLTNTATRAITITIAARNEAGERVLLDQITLGARVTRLIYVGQQWPALAAHRGVLDFSTTDYGMMLVALRINPTNSYTPLEAFEPL